MHNGSAGTGQSVKGVPRCSKAEIRQDILRAIHQFVLLVGGGKVDHR